MNEMKLKNIIQQILFAAVSIVFFAACSDNEGSFVLRSDNHVDLDYTASPGTFTVCTNGAWKITSTANWFTVSPTEGTGDGTKREVVTITPTQNTGAVRTDSLYLEAAGKNLGIGIQQEEGFVQLGTPSFVGGLTKGKNAEHCFISVPYSKAYEGQSYTATVTMTGSGNGLTVADYTYTTDASGSINIPVVGIPTTGGTVTFSISTGLPNAQSLTVNTIIANGEKETLIYQNFSKFVFGGDDASYVSGLLKDGVTVATPRTDGSSDVFLTENQDYRDAHEVTGWSGSKAYERPGYLKMGTGSANGYITTPALSAMTETQDVILTFNAMNWDQISAVTALTFTINGGGTPDITTYNLPGRASEAAGTWSTITVNIKNATPSTTIKIAGGARFLIDNIKVTTTGL